MANPLQIRSKSQMIEQRAQMLFGSILSDYKRGVIKSKVDLQYLLFVALQEFYNNIGKPTLKVNHVWGPPVSGEWNTMMKRAYDDVAMLMSEANLIANAVSESFTQVETQRQSWLSGMQKLQNRLNDMESKISAKPTEMIFIERFADMKNYDPSMAAYTPADIIKESQVLTLKRSSAHNIVDSLIIRVTNGNGFPGNTHQVRAISGAYKFYGEDNLHMNMAEMIDGNMDTWFEYELFEIDSSLAERTGSFGFGYKEGFPWADPSVTGLTLTVQIYLPVMRTINWLNIAPFIPSDKGVNAANLKSIIVSDEKGNYMELSSGKDTFSKELIKQFPKINCKTVTLVFEQKTPYQTQVGHIYFNELEKQNVGYLNRNSQDTAGKRVKGPLPSIENVQLHYDPSTQKLVLPSALSGDSIPNDADIKKNLFQLPSNPSGTQVALEALDAWRYMVGVREVGIAEYTFEAMSEYTSVPYVVDKPIVEVRLDVDEEIPQSFRVSSERQNWTAYYISIDEGKTWNPIAPTGQTGAVTKYLINSNTPKEARFSTVGYIDTLQPVLSVRVRIDLFRPTTGVDVDHYTPIVRQYKLHVLTTEGSQ